jgi:hypothetical protein
MEDMEKEVHSCHRKQFMVFFYWPYLHWLLWKTASNVSFFSKCITMLQDVMIHQSFLAKAFLCEVFVPYSQIRYMPKNGTSEAVFYCTKAYYQHHNWSHILRCCDPLYCKNSHVTCWKDELMFYYVLIHRWYFMVGLQRRSLTSISYLNWLSYRHRMSNILHYLLSGLSLVYIFVLYLLTCNGLEKFL